MLNVLDLFSGIGGFSLGLERTGGFKTVAFCEIEPYCRAVLAKHWPDVPCFTDVRTLTAADVGAIDVICGGFPCQDISVSGKGAGIDGERSGLWREYARLVGEIRPRYVIVENVSALLGRGLGDVLGDLAGVGYDAEWHRIPASYVGAPHRRDRLWLVAYPGHLCWRGWAKSVKQEWAEIGNNGETLADTECARLERLSKSRSVDSGGNQRERTNQPAEGCGDVADTDSERGRGRNTKRQDAEDARQPSRRAWSRAWDVEPDVGRVANGVPSRVDRLRALGNAVVPQIPEIIGRAILEAEAMTQRAEYVSDEGATI